MNKQSAFHEALKTLFGFQGRKAFFEVALAFSPLILFLLVVIIMALIKWGFGNG